MGIKTEDFAPNIPPKEMTEGVDWMNIFDSFDPTSLSDRFINECARRNQYYTCYKWTDEGLAPEPVEGRLKDSRIHVEYERRELESCVGHWYRVPLRKCYKYYENVNVRSFETYAGREG